MTTVFFFTFLKAIWQNLRQDIYILNNNVFFFANISLVGELSGIPILRISLVSNIPFFCNFAALWFRSKVGDVFTIMLDFRHFFRLAISLPLLLFDNIMALYTLHRVQQLGVGGLITKSDLHTGQLASLPLKGNVSHLLLVLKTTPAPTNSSLMESETNWSTEAIKTKAFKASNKQENIQIKVQPNFSQGNKSVF